MADRAQDLRVQAGASRKKPIPGTREFEWQKFGEPADHILDHDSGYPPGPEGTEWETYYRSLTLSDEDALPKGLPSHEEAIKAIDRDAAQSNGRTQLHKSYVLYAKHHSEPSRPGSATEALRRLYAALLEREFTSDWQSMLEPEPPFEGDPNLTICRDVVYGTVDPKLQSMDVYLVKSEEPTPVMIEFHGGGWRRGSKRQFYLYKGNLIRAILDAGISLVAVDYRLTPEYRFPAQMEDAVRAVQFVRFKAEEWNIDPRRIAAMGGSAGGHLTTWIAMNDDQARLESDDPVARQSSRLTCFVCQWAPLDFTRVNPMLLRKHGPRGPDVANAFCSALGLRYEDYNRPEAEERLRAASPAFQVTPDDPPGFLMFGGAPEDFDANNPPPVPEVIHDPHSFWHGVILAEKMKAAGIEYVPYIGSWVGRDHKRDVEALLAFLKKHFGMH